MKKINLILSALFLISTVTGCTSTSKDALYTSPETDVLIYGYASNVSSMNFYRTRLGYGGYAENEKVSKPKLIQGGLIHIVDKPGSSYKLKQLKIIKDNLPYIYSFHEGSTFMNYNFPEKPGLYYIGSIDMLKTLSTYTYTELYLEGDALYTKIKITEKLLNKYINTPWEDEINATLDFLYTKMAENSGYDLSEDEE